MKRRFIDLPFVGFSCAHLDCAFSYYRKLYTYQVCVCVCAGVMDNIVGVL